MSTTTPSATHCPACQSRLEADGVCLACLFSEALSAPDADLSNSSTLANARAYATLGRLELPCSLAGYRLLREIASGGMGIVYEAEDSRLKRRVALKMLRAAAFARPEELARFRVEAELAAQLDHPNIVPIYEVGDVDGMPFFTMRLIEGMSLAEKLQNADGAMNARDAAALMVKVANAVQHAHERGVLHRDLKPGNILLDEHGEPHLTDFGLAKLLDDDSMLTRSTAHLGTPHYMSPEQAAGRTREVTTASDVWALGVLLYQLLTLKLPFHGEGGAAVMQAIQQAQPVALTGLEPDLATLVQRCLEKEPSKRPASAGFLADELERWQNGEAILSRPVDAMERTLRWVRRNRTKAAAIVLTSLALIIGSGVALWQRDQALWQKSQALAARDEAQRQLREAEGMTDLMLGTLELFDDRRGGPVTSKEALVTEFLERVEAYEGDPRRQIELLLKGGTLNGRDYPTNLKALEIAERTLSSDDLLLWLLRSRVAVTRPTNTDEQKQESIQDLHRIGEWCRVHLGPEHPTTLNNLQLLASRLSLWGSPAEGLALFEQIKTALEKCPEYPLKAQVAVEGGYMEALFQNGRVEEALAVGRETCARWLSQVTSLSSHELARTFDRLAVICLRTGLLEEAARHARQGLEIYWQFEGPGSKGGLDSLRVLLLIQRKQGDREAVLATHRDALRAFDIAYGPSRIETQRRVAAYADELANFGHKPEAEALYQQWLDRLRGSDGVLAPQAAELEKLYAAFLKLAR